MTSMITKRSQALRRATAVLAAGAAAVLLAACGGSGDDAGGGHNGHGNGSGASASPSAPASKGAQNAADVKFAQGMIPHHRQAIEMADLAPTRAESPAVKKLAADIKNAQDPEIKTLSDWLTSWGEEVPAPGAMDHSMHGGGDMGGMMTTEEMNGLKNAKGKAFDTAFMELMIKHHEGAVTMAKTEQAKGAFADAKTMAQAIITSQSAEIAQMNKLLGKS